MKPTKEQLADPKWWDENANGYDYVFYLERNDEYIFADDNGEGINFKLIVGAAGWKLLAKRPEPLSEKWKPKEGEWFTGSGGAQMAFIGIDSGNAYVCEIKGGGGLTRLYDFDGCKPIKTQREKLKEIIKDNLEANVGLSDIAGVILARFDLTEKDDK